MLRSANVATPLASVLCVAVPDNSFSRRTRALASQCDQDPRCTDRITRAVLDLHRHRRGNRRSGDGVDGLLDECQPVGGCPAS